LGGLLGLALICPTVASAESVAQLKGRLEELKARSAQAGKAFSDGYWKLDETEGRLAKTRVRLSATERKLKASKQRLNGRAEEIYRREDLGLLQFLVGSQSYEQFVTRAQYLARIGSADAHAVAEVRELTRQLKREREQLEADRKVQAKDVARLKRDRDALQTRLKSLEGEFRRVKRQLDAARTGRNTPSGVASAAGPNGLVFPVAGSYYYADTWGASRSGGRRRHQGTDIMAPHGTPCVATLSGTVRAKQSSLGGMTIWLSADNGWSFYYAHLQGYAVTSGRVRAGQVIGYVGSSGNAAANAPHLHFEIHPGGGGAVNPYSYLRAME
jgi:murein DD-endopeptidase MepM/ murein hydrolase activator NlpD